MANVYEHNLNVKKITFSGYVCEINQMTINMTSFQRWKKAH